MRIKTTRRVERRAEARGGVHASLARRSTVAATDEYRELPVVIRHENAQVAITVLEQEDDKHGL